MSTLGYELAGTDLAQRCGGGRRCLVGDRVVGALCAVTVSGNHDDTVNLGVSHGGGVCLTAHKLV